MGRGIVNIIIGGVFIVGGATESLVLLGTNSTTAIMGVGIALAAYGIFQIAKRR